MTNKNSKDDLSKSINDAINNMNFNDISKKIKTSVDTAIKSTLDMIGGIPSKVSTIQTRNPKVCAQRLPEKSKSSGFKFLSIIIGLIGLSIGIPLILDGPIYSMLIQKIIGIVVLLGSGVFSTYFWRKSKYMEVIGQNYIRFLRELGHNTVIPVRDLASSVQQTEEDTVNDLLYMMQNGYFHQARIVENDSLFLLDIPTFKLYKNQASKIDREETEEIQENSDNKKAKSIIENGQIYLDRITNSMEKIQNRVFLNKVEKVKKTIKNILSLIKKYPDKAYALDKFMDYYLPTTAKLVDTYIEFESMNTGDEKILSSMQEIDKSIETINEAYEKIQVELLSDRAMDIQTDIDTMKLLLNQEGLLKDDWSNK